MSNLKNLPEITFAERDPAVIRGSIRKTVEELLGRTLARADPLWLFLEGIESIIIHQREIIDRAAKMNLLAFAKESYLDHIGAMMDTPRLGEAAAIATFYLALSAPRGNATVIRAGTRATAGDGVYFALDEDVIIPAGELRASAQATCTIKGTAGNGYLPGEISEIVDPHPFLETMTNITASEGGADVEEDDNYRERIQEAPERFSVAGPEGAYRYFAKTASALITDVSVKNGGPGIVEVKLLLAGGELPGEEILRLVYETLNDDKIRPLTDCVKVEAPTVTSYTIDVSYWIDREDAASAATIQKAVEKAVADFVSWQKEKLGRDINPTELYHRIRAAGAKRATVRAPNFIVVPEDSVAIERGVTVSLEGLEDG